MLDPRVKIDTTDRHGLVFGRLTVIERDYSTIKPMKFFCKCECGTEGSYFWCKLRSGWTKSCGCILRKHGLSKEPEYNTWNLMIQRCYNKNINAYKYYGAIGISVCVSWSDEITGYKQFIEDLGSRPSKYHTIERVDVFGNYCKENCIWTDDLSLQAYNQKIKVSNTSGRTGVSFDKSKTLKKWKASISKDYKIIKALFMTFEEAVSQREIWELEIYGSIKGNGR